jgi:C-terminal processing protease CtpA/Prc
MKTLQTIAFAAILLFICISVNSCKDDNDDETIPSETIAVNKFINDGMKQIYLWNTSMPIISYTHESDSEAYFYKLLNKTYDRWSYITDDYEALVNALNGIQTDFGYSYVLTYVDNSQTTIVGIVEYVNSGSPAEKAGIKRGDIMYKIDGNQLNNENYQSLLNQPSYTLTLAYINGGLITPLSPSLSMTAQVLNINPIHYHDIIEQNGKKIGYLVYNSFIETYDEQLKAVFNQFKENNVSELVLDLRYNGGGAVTSAQLLASMIGPADIASKTMINNTYNDLVKDYFQTKDDRDEYFSMDFIPSTSNLNLQRVFVLTTQSTASASEMIIYALEPYMDVIQIGMETTGKYYASTLLNDEEGKHNWAMLPLFMKIQNSTNSIEYATGLIPDYRVEYDDYKHQLGDVNETMLKQALSIIDGNYSAISELKSSSKLIEVKNAKENLNPIRNIMLMKHD